MPDSITAGKSLFVIGPIGTEGSAVRRHADYFFNFIIEPVAGDLEMATPLRADMLAGSSQITHDIMHHLTTDDVVIADLSFANANAFYELAVRHLVGKPFVHAYTTGDALPFDVQPTRAVPFDLTDLASVDQAKRKLTASIEAVLHPDWSPDIPFSVPMEIDTAPSAEAGADGGLDAILRLQDLVLSVENGLRALQSDVTALIRQSTPKIFGAEWPAGVSGTLIPPLTTSDKYKNRLSGSLTPLSKPRPAPRPTKRAPDRPSG